MDSKLRLGIAAGVVGVTAFGYYLWQKRQGLRVARLVVYPVKGCKGVEVRSAKLLTEGLEHDREYLVASKDEAGTWSFRSQRDIPKMALIEPMMPTADGKLEVRAPGMTPLEVGLPSAGAKSVTLDIWGDKAEGLDCGDAAAAWFEKYLEFPGVRLLHHTGTRKIDANFGEGTTRFSDGYPVMITTEASLKDVETATGVSHGCERMRPNIILSGATKYAEDSARGVTCGGEGGQGGGAVRFNFLKPCPRCTVPRVDPTTGTIGKDPVAALKPYRSGKVLVDDPQKLQTEIFGKNRGQVFFGQNGQPELAKFFGGVTTISVGDPAMWI
mmetsp:Transcript_54485/g.129884  ORF Transcript_54485/g.129884 Transcript_54485/m.129884 type:complete len:327 (-) Transcript_54485:155-1135(-)